MRSKKKKSQQAVDQLATSQFVSQAVRQIEKVQQLVAQLGETQMLQKVVAKIQQPVDQLVIVFKSSKKISKSKMPAKSHKLWEQLTFPQFVQQLVGQFPVWHNRKIITLVKTE